MSIPESDGPAEIRTRDLRHVKATLDKKPLPKLTHLCRIPLNFVKVYAPAQGVVLKAHRENGDSPELFLDLEDSGRAEGVEVHVGIGGRFRVEQLRNTAVKVHIDAYAPKDQIPELLKALGRVGA